VNGSTGSGYTVTTIPRGWDGVEYRVATTAGWDVHWVADMDELAALALLADVAE
jgi:hypothetical protein